MSEPLSHERIVARGAAAEAILRDPSYTLRPSREPVPRGLAGTTLAAWYERLARTSDGEPHRRRKAMLVRACARIDADDARDAARRIVETMLADGAALDHATLDAFLHAAPTATTALLLDVPLRETPDAVASTHALI